MRDIRRKLVTMANEVKTWFLFSPALLSVYEIVPVLYKNDLLDVILVVVHLDDDKINDKNYIR